MHKNEPFFVNLIVCNYRPVSPSPPHQQGAASPRQQCRSPTAPPPVPSCGGPPRCRGPELLPRAGAGPEPPADPSGSPLPFMSVSGAPAARRQWNGEANQALICNKPCENGINSAVG